MQSRNETDFPAKKMIKRPKIPIKQQIIKKTTIKPQ